MSTGMNPDALREALLPQFVDDSERNLSKLEANLAELEARPDDAELVEEIVRAVHSINGDARSLQLMPLSEFAFSLEYLLEEQGHRVARLPSRDSAILSEAIAALRTMIRDIAAGAALKEIRPEHQELQRRLGAMR